jgi:Ca2+-binding RTX toxin-like protein
MAGGTGDDTYYVDDSGDAITELSGEGNDRIAASISFALAADANIERIEAVNLGATNAMDLTGSGIANIIYGNDGTNILRGEGGNDELRGFGGDDFLVGGPGTDLMVGGLGNDTFYVDDASDAIGEIAGQGNDRIAASVSFVLSNGADVEILEAVNLASTTPFDLTGSDSNNIITGNAGSNILRGEGGADTLSGAGGNDFLVGGAGNDVMNGGTGNDTFYVDAIGDVVNEFAGEGGLDRVVASASYALSATADVELLETATQSGTAAINLVGSSVSNSINGNDGANVLDGRGGNDILTGYGGADTFQFGTALGATNVDTIIGFVTGSDKIALDDAIFAAIGPLGALNANAFFAGAAAHEADDRIIYNAATGALLYDADGELAGAAVQFATLGGNPALAAGDFIVI